MKLTARNHPLRRADRAAVDPHPADVCLHAGRRLDAQPGATVNARAIMELPYSRAARRRHHAAGSRASTSSSSANGLFVVHDNVFFNQQGEVI